MYICRTHGGQFTIFHSSSVPVFAKKQSSGIPAGEGPSNPAPHISMFRCRAGVDCLCEKNSHPRERGQMFSSTLRCGGSGGASLVYIGHFVDDCFFRKHRTQDPVSEWQNWSLWQTQIVHESNSVSFNIRFVWSLAEPTCILPCKTLHR